MITLAKHKQNALSCLTESKRLLVLSESYEQVDAIDELIKQLDKTTDVYKIGMILKRGLRTQREGQTSWEQRIKENKE